MASPLPDVDGGGELRVPHAAVTSLGPNSTEEPTELLPPPVPLPSPEALCVLSLSPEPPPPSRWKRAVIRQCPGTRMQR